MPMKIKINGPVVDDNDGWIYELFGIECTYPKQVTSKLDEANGDEIELLINSGGGSVYSASEIYTHLKSYAGKVEAKIIGVAASAASVIAMAGDKTVMSPTSKMMIHNSAMGTYGDYREMDKASEILKKTNQTISNAYRIKSGLSEDELLSMMDEESWFTPQEAKEKGLIDAVMFEEEAPQLVASTGIHAMLPQEVINTVRNNKELVAGVKNEEEKPTKRLNINVDLEENESFNKFISKIENLENRLSAFEKQNTNQNKDEPEPENKSGFSRFIF